jgi:hypothetical protein
MPLFEALMALLGGIDAFVRRYRCLCSRHRWLRIEASMALIEASMVSFDASMAFLGHENDVDARDGVFLRDLHYSFRNHAYAV